MKLTAYVEWLVSTNSYMLARRGKSLVDSRANFLIGFVEEYFEWLEANTEDEKVKELGDVLAYYCLALSSLGFSPEFITEQLKYDHVDKNKAILNSVGEAKRILRGDKGADVKFAKAGSLLIQQMSEQNDVSLEELAEVNRSKLTARLNNTGTFQGRGDR